MKKLTLAFAATLVVLVISAGAFVPDQPAVPAQGAIPKSAIDGMALFVPQEEKPIPLTIVDKRKQKVKEETLSPENRERIESVRKAARSIQMTYMAGLIVKIHCSFPPLKCTIDVVFAS